MTNFITFVVKSRALDTFLRPLLCGVDFAVLRLTCRTINGLLGPPRGRFRVYSVAALLGYYKISELFASFRGGKSGYSLEELFAPSFTDEDFEAQKRLNTRFNYVIMVVGLGGIATCGNLPLIKWARKKGTCFDLDFTSIAAKNDHLEILQWAREEGAPFDIVKLMNMAQNHGKKEIVEWLAGL